MIKYSDALILTPEFGLQRGDLITDGSIIKRIVKKDECEEKY